jgi:hypothetical protein
VEFKVEVPKKQKHTDAILSYLMLHEKSALIRKTPAEVKPNPIGLRRLILEYRKQQQNPYLYTYLPRISSNTHPSLLLRKQG